MPGFDGELTGDQRRYAAMALLDDLHEIAPLAGIEAAERPATPDELNEMGEYSRWLAHREPTGSEAQRVHSAERLAQLAAKPNGKTPPVTVPAEN